MLLSPFLGFFDANLTQFNFHFENDVFFQTDEYYNHSSKLEWIFQNKKYLYNFNIKQEMYTPHDHKKGYLLKDDMPYTATLQSEYGLHYNNNNTLYSFDMGLGFTGKYTFGEETMALVHSLLPTNPIYKGWDSQKGFELLFHMAYTQKYRYVFIDGKSDVILNYGINIGNLRSDTFFGGEFRYGIDIPNDFGIYSSYSNHLNFTDKSSSHLYLLGGVTQAYIYNDMTLRHLAMYHYQTTFYTGISYKKEKYNLSLILNKETKRFHTQKNDGYGYGDFIFGWSY